MIKTYRDDFLSKTWQRILKDSVYDINKIVVCRNEKNEKRMYVSLYYEDLEITERIDMKQNRKMDIKKLERIIKYKIGIYHNKKIINGHREKLFFDYLCDKCALEYGYEQVRYISLKKAELFETVMKAAKSELKDFRYEAQRIAPLMIKAYDIQKENKWLIG